jgi:aspartate/methionine/tyrosine aminotransferase
MKFAQRLQFLSANVFADMDRAKAEAQQQGQHLIDLSLGSSDLPAHPQILAAMAEALQRPQTHGYLLHQGTLPFRQAVAQWYEARFGLGVDPETEVLSLIGSQEGTAHFPLAILNPGEVALLLDPGYPSHAGGVYLAGGEIYPMPLRPENQFLPVFSDIPDPILARAKLMVLSYPHNPTTAMASLDFFQAALAFAQRYDLVVVHDFPYCDLVFDGAAPPPSFLQADRSRERSIEFFTFSKSYNMGGFRIGFAVGNAQLIQALRRIKAIVDFNQYQGILQGAMTALQGPPQLIQATVQTFAQRRDHFIQALADIHWLVPSPPATMYVWASLPAPWQTRSVEFCRQLVLQTGVAASPGAGFGPSGEGFVRFALVQDPATLVEAVRRLQGFLLGQTSDGSSRF